MSDRTMMLLPCMITFFFLLLGTCRSSDTLDVHQNISDGDTIVSGNSKFELGFFSPGNSKNRYLGIWFKNTSSQTVIWVANRDAPLINNSGVLTLDNQGNLSLVSGIGKVIWSSNSSASGTSVNLVAQLLDTGNLVIKSGNEPNNETFIWQSFDYPGDTFMEGMKLGKNFITGRETYLTSWRSEDDPSQGEYTLRFFMIKGKYQQLYIRKGSSIETRIGPYNGILFSGRPLITPDTADPPFASYMVVNQNEMYFATISIKDTTRILSRMVVTPGGKLEILQLKLPSSEWLRSLTLPVDNCDNYGVCGPYGSCNTDTSPYCGCLKGFERNTSGNTNICQQSIALDCGPGERFYKFSSMKLPDTDNAIFRSNMSLLDCEAACKNNCSCTAYANPNRTPGGIGCLIWFGGLIDVRVYSQNGQDLFVRLAATYTFYSRSSFHRKKKVVLEVTLSISAVVTVLCLILAFYTRRKWKKRSNAEREGKPLRTIIEDYKGGNGQMGSVEVQLFSLAKIARATNDFSVYNELGKGGFGPVYKGVLDEGQDIAVKRLSKSSRQGFDEFENEVLCIAKLQHRNLVKLLGYCIEGNEKMLIYEYMPNKSLDGFLFDESRKLLLDWPQRFRIIHGIARGLLYLHQDFRLKVVHRDLKAGNILLDHQIRPRISDFGLARMFKEDESEGNTKRVVGTLGYISPEYAANGLYSVKSDIFSFGVLVLEIVSGKKNRGFVHEDHDDNLLGHAWRLYTKGKSLDLIDESLRGSYSASEVLRAVHVGLLCVQQRVEDRPDTPTVVAFLGGEGARPSPKKPAFFIQESEINSTSSLPSLPSSVNVVTLSQVDGRY
ncbi:G-type lectin S-receptor-like serine/threonine-protein kinase At4g27290 [Bidens hawaiensis]|uniref:G-type lectin S-receptor-like serine/threonine-protein kinase At4g27290 n=1 Tax=Bidens hawaiensis TaxID=980011 RepID=UPI004049D0B0